eukprot:scaffold39618_cov63-Phaeocystis_antarctica.AAC.1
MVVRWLVDYCHQDNFFDNPRFAWMAQRDASRACWTQAACCAAPSHCSPERGGSGHGMRCSVLGLLGHVWLARRTVDQQFRALLRCVMPKLGRAGTMQRD